MSSYPKINWLTRGTDLDDYRPAIGPDSKTVIFERTLPNTTETKLYMVEIHSGGTPAPVLPNLAGAQTRPDWCWHTGHIAFNSNDLVGIMETVGQSGLLTGTNKFIYPQWDTRGKTLTVMNSSSGGIKPRSSVIDPQTGAVLTPNINGNDAGGVALFGGMPAVKPKSSSIAFAGQPALAAWNSGSSTPSYDQHNNYIFLNSSDGSGNFSSSPAEPGAPIDNYNPHFQGRAPAWSPNGRFIVFESTRNANAFALFLLDLKGDGTPVQLTDTVYQAQHAKFFPDGNSLIFCGKPTPTSRNRIASINIYKGLV